MAEIEGKVEVTEPTTEVTPVVEKETPPTAEEQLATLRQEMGELKTRAERLDKENRSTQATLTQKDRLLKEKETTASRLDTIEDSMQILAGLIAKGENIDPEHADSYKKEFAALKTKREQESLRASHIEYNQRADAIYSRAKESIRDKKDLKMVELLLLNGKPEDADEMVLDAEKEIKPVDNKPTDAERKLEEALKKIERLEKIQSGELDTERGLPSGAAASEAEIRKNYREHPDNPKAFSEYLALKRSKQ